MAKYIKDTTEAANRLRSLVGRTLTEELLCEIFLQSVKTLPWQAQWKVKMGATENFARTLGVKTRQVIMEGRDGREYEGIQIVPEE